MYEDDCTWRLLSSALSAGSLVRASKFCMITCTYEMFARYRHESWPPFPRARTDSWCVELCQLVRHHESVAHPIPIWAQILTQGAPFPAFTHFQHTRPIFLSILSASSLNVLAIFAGESDVPGTVHKYPPIGAHGVSLPEFGISSVIISVSTRLVGEVRNIAVGHKPVS